MPLTQFYCPDGEKILVKDCLAWKGCRLKKRCCPRPILRRTSWDRDYRGVTWSQAGNDARLIWLKAVEKYAVLPDDRMFAVLGIDTHAKLADERLIDDALSEEKVKDEKSGQSGILDLLEPNEYGPPDTYILTDYKTSGSYQIAKWTGRKVKKEDRPVMDKDTGKQVVYKSGKRKGQLKFKQHKSVVIDYEWMNINKRGINHQVNRYRIEVERRGFEVSRMEVFAIPRDGGLWIAHSRGIHKRGQSIPISRLNDEAVIEFYNELQRRVDQAFKDDYAPVCGSWQNWDGMRCANYCDVKEPCQSLCKERRETWPGMGKARKQEED